MIPAGVWKPAYDPGVAELTDLLDLSRWPPGDARHRPKRDLTPGAQLRLTDLGGCRVTAFATNTCGGQLADLELRHRRFARGIGSVVSATRRNQNRAPATTPTP